jgi:hypothetical protein
MILFFFRQWETPVVSRLLDKCCEQFILPQFFLDSFSGFSYNDLNKTRYYCLQVPQVYNLIPFSYEDSLS